MLQICGQVNIQQMQDSNQGKLQVTLTKPSFNTNLTSDFSTQYIVNCRTPDQRSCGWEDLCGCKENQWSLCKRNSAFDVIRIPHIWFRESLTENRWVLGEDLKKTSHTYPVPIFAQYPTMTDVLLGSPLGSGISPTLTKLQSPPWERGWEGKEKKAGRNQTITEHRQTERRETPYKKWVKGSNCRNSSVAVSTAPRRDPESPTTKFCLQTWQHMKHNHFQSPSSSPLLGLHMATAWRGRSYSQSIRQDGSLV